MNKKIAIVTGGTSGIGKATALALRGAGYTVYEFSRREAGVEGLHHIRADITDETPPCSRSWTPRGRSMSS